MRLRDERLELLGNFEIDHAASSTRSNRGAFEHADRAQLPIPELHRVLLDEAVTAQQLHAVGADLHALVGALDARQRGLAAEAQALLGAAGGALHHQAHAIELERDVGDHERHRLAVGDGLAEGADGR